MKPTPRILVVDDEESNLDLFSRRLTRAGYLVDTARDGLEALQIAERGQIDLVLLDQMMPGLSGLQVLSELRKKYTAQQLPVIMVTALTDSSQVVEALDHGSNDYVTKPVDFQVALARIRAQLGHQNADRELRKSEERYALALRGSGRILFDWDRIEDTVYYSPEWYRLLGFEPEDAELKNEKRFSRVHPFDLPLLKQALNVNENSSLPASEAKEQNPAKDSIQVEFRVRRRDGEYRWVSLQGMTFRNAASVPVRFIGSLTDITVRKTVDELTGLENELTMMNELQATILRYQEYPATTFAVLIFKVDTFGLIEQSLGQAASEELLQEVARKAQTALFGCVSMKDLARPCHLRPAHISKDEFGLVIDPVHQPAEAEAVAACLVAAMRSPIIVAQREVICSIRIGLVLYQPEYRDPLALIRDARTALSAAKPESATPWKIFDASMRKLQEDLLQLDIDLRHALERHEFEVYYQSRVSLATFETCGFEALVRWNHPTRHLVLPDAFISLAEEHGLIHEIGIWVLRQACEQLRLWQQAYVLPEDFEVSVNLSAHQCREPLLVQQVSEILRETGLPPVNLNLELTESRLLDNIEEARTILRSLKSLGVGLKMDDFGTGYSSLKYLNELPFDCLKIDRSFTANLDKNEQDTVEIIRTILQMARNLNMEVVAEGIESAAQFARLKKMGCQFGQGFFFSRPVCVTETESLIAGHFAKRQTVM
jgi:EAL domain-containing protein (putative c-di-GMP-specific phosphodiesterase class I)/PleD family two-component response regulator